MLHTEYRDSHFTSNLRTILGMIFLLVLTTINNMFGGYDLDLGPGQWMWVSCDEFG